MVFPGEYAPPERVLQTLPEAAGAGPRPLFVLLDATWPEARKMFRKSPYLDALPVLSLHPEQASNYRLRRSVPGHHLCTAEVAATCLDLAGEGGAAQGLSDWLDVFSAHYLHTRRGLSLDTASAAHQRLLGLAGAAGG